MVVATPLKMVEMVDLVVEEEAQPMWVVIIPEELLLVGKDMPEVLLLLMVNKLQVVVVQVLLELVYMIIIHMEVLA